MNKKLKYGEAENIEAWTDTNFFFGISEKLSHVMHNWGFTPNQVTWLSLISQLYASYLLYNGNHKNAAIFYIIGYILDSIDGRIARNYKMYSKFGEAFDMVTDIIANAILFIVMLNVYKNNNYIYVIILLGFTYMANRWYGYVEALNNFKKFGDDNFLKTKQKKFTENNLLNKFYLFLVKGGYNQYKKENKKFNKKKVYKKLDFLKHFGPGNLSTLVFIILYCIPINN